MMCLFVLSFVSFKAIIEGQGYGMIGFPEIGGSFSFADVSQSILLLQQLALGLRTKRFVQGALRIDLPVLSFSLDPESRMPTGLRPHEVKDSNRLVEEFMLLANMQVAQKIYQVLPDLAVLRCHPPPCAKQLQQLSATMQTAGVHLDVSSSASIQESLLRCNPDKIDPASIGRHLVVSKLLVKQMKVGG